MFALVAQYAQDSGGSAAVSLLLIVGFAAIFGAWSANAAERKGIPRSTGWALGLLLGLIGRIIVGLMRDRTLQQQPVVQPVRPDLPLPTPPPVEQDQRSLSKS
jgi:hypothetical protein